MRRWVGILLLCCAAVGGLLGQQRRDVVAAIAFEPPPASRRAVLGPKPPVPVPDIEVDSRRSNPNVNFPGAM